MYKFDRRKHIAKIKWRRLIRWSALDGNILKIKLVNL
nr:MAG TPA: hypothetical protein [Caudoviricetes sp.]